ncbi:response regulator [Pseudomonas citronellolis]|uniref:response regulator n=1 Tax=Pseudomonas citronellolis TaxID=53408 RepID=UPI0023E3A73C|nr:response regulator [Pseudomonas citronellolis]MDF3934475.1 response regulator [Pseudomonas citronellolis]
MSTVLLADATPIVRSALRDLLQQMGHQVSAEAADSPTALSLAREHRPDLVILELALPGAGGLDLLRRLKARDPTQRVLVYSRQSASHFAPLCFQAGAGGFVSKQEDLGELRRAIVDVLAGRAHFAREHMEQGSGDELGRLTPRELSVLQMLAEGQSNQRIADSLLISFKTVSTYKTRLLEKLHVGSNVELAEIARRNGLVPGGQATGGAAREGVSEEAGLLRQLVDSAPDPMFVRDVTGRLLLCNQRFLDYYRISAGEALGSSLADARWFPPEVRERLPISWQRRVREGVPVAERGRVEVYGDTRVLHFWMVPYRGESGQFVGLLGGIRDVTESEQHLAELRDRLLAAESQSRRLLESWEASLAELAELLGGLGLHPATPGLARLSERLDRLRRTCDLEEGPLPSAPEPCELPALLTRLLAARPGARLVISRLEATRVWLDVRAFRELLGSTLALFQGEPQALELDLATQAASRGYLQVRLRLRGAAGLASVINLTHCQRLAERLGVILQYAADADDALVVELELELPESASA